MRRFFDGFSEKRWKCGFWVKSVIWAYSACKYIIVKYVHFILTCIALFTYIRTGIKKHQL